MRGQSPFKHAGTVPLKHAGTVPLKYAGTVPLTLPSVEDDATALAADLKQVPRTLADARLYAAEKLRRKRGFSAFELLKSRPSDYGLVIKPTGHYNEKVIGAKEEVEKYIYTQGEKRMQNSVV